MATVRRQSSPAGQALRRAISTLGTTEGRVGWFESAKYEDGTPAALVAVVQEYGSSKNKIPPRSVMRSTQAEAQAEWRTDARALAQAVATGKAPPTAVMEGLTMKAEGAIRKKIATITEPALSPKTVKARKRRLANKGKKANPKSISKPLVDTAFLMNSLSSQVKKT
jgi:hypothetical protein